MELNSQFIRINLQLEMAPDPFLEAGIPVPSELPYQENNKRDNSSKKSAR